MTDIDKCALDPDEMEGGRWFDWMRGARLKLRAFASTAYQDKLEELMEPHRALLAAAPESDEAKRITKEVGDHAIAETAVVDWNLTRDGQPLPCTPDTVLALVSDRRHANLRRFIVASCSQDYLARAEAADAGN